MRLLSQIILLVLFCTPASAEPFILQGKVEHSTKVNPLAVGLRTGDQFQESKFKEPRYASSWFMIPAWFAGQFQVDENVITKIEDCRSGKIQRPNQAVSNYGRELHGFQKDAQNQIWHFYVESGTSKSEQLRQITYNNIDWYGPVRIDKKRVIMRIMATSLLVDRTSGVIVDSFRREDIKTYEPYEPGKIKVTYTSKSFDSSGHPRDLQEGVAIHKQIAPFQEINLLDNVDYRIMFRDYLLSNNHKELVPQALR